MKPLPVVQTPETRPGPSTETRGETRDETGDARTEAVPVSDTVKTAELEPLIVDALRTVFDPEIPVNIYELGLIYGVVVDASGAVTIEMTLTAPACPAAQSATATRLLTPHLPTASAVDGHCTA